MEKSLNFEKRFILEYSDAIKKQKEEEKENGKKLEKKTNIRQNARIIRKETENSIGTAKRTWRHRRKTFWTDWNSMNLYIDEISCLCDLKVLS